MRDIAEWKRGDVVSVTDPAHPEAVCILTTGTTANEPRTWALVDETCYQWRSTEWVEARNPHLLVRGGTAPARPSGRRKR